MANSINIMVKRQGLESSGADLVEFEEVVAANVITKWAKG